MCCESRLCSAASLCQLAFKPISYPIIFIHRVIFAIFAQNEIAKIALTERREYRNFPQWDCTGAGRPGDRWIFVSKAPHKGRPGKEATFGRVMPQKGFLKTSERIRRYLDVRLHDVPARNEGRAPEPPHPADDA